MNMVIAFMFFFVWNITGFNLFSKYREAFPLKLLKTYSNLVNYTPVTFFFFTLPFPSRNARLWFRAVLSDEWERLS